MTPLTMILSPARIVFHACQKALADETTIFRCAWNAGLGKAVTCLNVGTGGGVGGDGVSAAVERDGQCRLWWARTPIDLFFAYDEFHDAMRKQEAAAGSYPRLPRRPAIQPTPRRAPPTL